MEAALAPGRGALGKLQAALAAASFMLLLAGTNTTTPLLPLYRDMLGFSPLTVTLTFVAYVSLLVATLAVASGPNLVRYAPSVLVAALAVALLADLALSTGTAPGILAGRALQGVSSGIGTGAAAALVVAVVGNRGRALTATGNLAGAILGTAAAQAVLHLAGARAISLSFEIHAGVCLAVALPLLVILRLRADANRAAIHVPTGTLPPLRPALLRHWRELLSGCISWCAISIYIVFLPTWFFDCGLPSAQALAVPLMLLGSLAAQLSSAALARAFPAASGMTALALGIAATLAGGALLNDYAAALGCLVAGAGAGLSFRCALVLLTRGASPAGQGRLASAYAAITYLAAAALVLLCGALANRFGSTDVTMALFAATAAAALSARRVAPRIGRLTTP